MGRTYRFYLSGNMNERHAQWILHELKIVYDASSGYPFGTDPVFFIDKISAVRNLGRGPNETTFDLDLTSNPGGGLGWTDDNYFDTLCGYILETIKIHDIEFEDITN